MHDFHCKSASEMYSEVLSGRVRTLKETEEGIEEMCRELEELYQMGMMDGRAEGRTEGIAEGITKGEQKAKKEIVFSMAEKELSVERIAELVKVSVQQVQEWLTGRPDTAR